MTASPVERTRPLREVVSEEIRALLARRRMNGVQLALRIGRSQSYVSRRLTGETAFDTDDLERIAEVLGVNVNSLFPPPDQANKVRVAYPFRAGPAPKPIIRGISSAAIGRPSTFGQKTAGRKIDTRPPGHPSDTMRRAA